MKVVQINHFSYKAAGNIMLGLQASMMAENIESYVVWGRGRAATTNNEYYMGDKAGVYLHALYTRISDRTGFASVHSTKRLITWLEQIKPDIIHLHCVHGYYINLPILFDYIRRKHIKVFWTQHDCWSFTGHCAYFDMVGCEKWKDGCHHCEQIVTYPTAYVDASKRNWHDKKNMFSGLNITIITPCEWLKNVMEKSFLNQYEIKVIHNGIDTDVFRFRENSVKEMYQIEKKDILLGVASEWSERKGLKDFLGLDKLIDHEKYQIVIVGVTAKQKATLPSTIIGIERTNNVQELIELYSAASCFINPTYEDNFPTTNLEALACGTPVITYKTGGSPESVCCGTGYVLEKGDVVGILKKIPTMHRSKASLLDNSRFSKEAMNSKYLELYKNAQNN